MYLLKELFSKIYSSNVRSPVHDVYFRISPPLLFPTPWSSLSPLPNLSQPRLPQPLLLSVPCYMRAYMILHKYFSVIGVITFFISTTAINVFLLQKPVFHGFHFQEVRGQPQSCLQGIPLPSWLGLPGWQTQDESDGVWGRPHTSLSGPHQPVKDLRGVLLKHPQGFCVYRAGSSANWKPGDLSYCFASTTK